MAFLFYLTRSREANDCFRMIERVPLKWWMVAVPWIAPLVFAGTNGVYLAFLGVGESFFLPIFQDIPQSLALMLCLAYAVDFGAPSVESLEALKPKVRAFQAINEPKILMMNLGLIGPMVLVKGCQAVNDVWRVASFIVGEDLDDDDEFKHASKKLKGDKKVVLAAVNKNGFAFLYADSELKKERDIVMAAVKQNGSVLGWVDDSELRNDPEIVMESIKQDWHAFADADAKLKKDREFILEAVKNDPRVLKYADEKLRNDWDFVMALVRENERAVDYVGLQLKDNIKEQMKMKKPLWQRVTH